MDFLDASYSFATIANQDNYTAGHLNFPVDLYAWSGFPYITETGSPLVVKQFIDGPRPIQEVRQYTVTNISALHPGIFAWYNRTMWLAPRPTGIVTIQGDYRRDGRRDSTSGDLITTTSTTHTNGWFDEGENALRCAVMLEWHASITKDSSSIQLYAGQLDQKLGILKKARDAKQSGLIQTTDSMFGGMPVGHSKSAWRYQ